MSRHDLRVAHELDVGLSQAARKNVFVRTDIYESQRIPIRHIATLRPHPANPGSGRSGCGGILDACGTPIRKVPQPFVVFSLVGRTSWHHEHDEERGATKTISHVAALIFAFATVVFFVAQTNGDTMVATSATSDDSDNAAELIAVKIRDQGYYCDTPQSAERERERSCPNETVWILKCMNATYRVKLIPDLAARVEHLN